MEKLYLNLQLILVNWLKITIILIFLKFHLKQNYKYNKLIE